MVNIDKGLKVSKIDFVNAWGAPAKHEQEMLVRERRKKMKNFAVNTTATIISLFNLLQKKPRDDISINGVYPSYSSKALIIERHFPETMIGGKLIKSAKLSVDLTANSSSREPKDFLPEGNDIEEFKGKAKNIVIEYTLEDNTQTQYEFSPVVYKGSKTFGWECSKIEKGKVTTFGNNDEDPYLDVQLDVTTLYGLQNEIDEILNLFQEEPHAT